MSKPSHTEIQNLLRDIVVPFYHIKRSVPLPVGERRMENDAEHSWSLAFLACTLAPLVDPSLDLGKLAQFAIAHDVVEVFAGDTSNFAPSEELATKDQREVLALKRIAKEFAHFPWIAETIEAYERLDTNEARFIYALDKYIVVVYDLMDEGKLFRDTKMTLDAYRKALVTHSKKAHSHPEVGNYYDEVRSLIESHTEYFHPSE